MQGWFDNVVRLITTVWGSYLHSVSYAFCSWGATANLVHADLRTLSPDCPLVWSNIYIHPVIRRTSVSLPQAVSAGTLSRRVHYDRSARPSFNCRWNPLSGTSCVWSGRSASLFLYQELSIERCWKGPIATMSLRNVCERESRKLCFSKTNRPPGPSSQHLQQKSRACIVLL